MSKLVPKLRFEGFSGEWELTTLEKTSDFINEKIKLNQIGLSNYISTENILANFEGITKSSKLPNITNVTKFKKHDVLMSNIRPYLKKVWLADINGGTSNDIIVTRAKKDNHYKFLLYIIQDDKFIDYVMQGAKGVKMPRGDISLIKKYPLALPKPLEQQKIASCLSSLDSLIEAQNKKIEALKKHKKGLMQQLFPKEGESVPTLRFDGFSGAWEEKTLGDCLDYLQPTKYLVKSTAYSDDYETPVLTAGKTFILGYTDEVNGIFEKNLPVIIFDDFTTATKYVDFPFKAKSSAMKILLAKDDVSIKFMYELMQTIRYQVGNHERHWISKFAVLNVFVPKPKEQQKIASCLSSLDSLIEANEQKVEALKKHKKSLMQQMFVSGED